MLYLKLENGRRFYSYNLPGEMILEERLRNVEDLTKRERIEKRYDQYCTYKDLKDGAATAPIYGAILAPIFAEGLLALSCLISGQKFPQEFHYFALASLGMVPIAGILYAAEKIKYSRLKKKNLADKAQKLDEL